MIKLCGCRGLAALHSQSTPPTLQLLMLESAGAAAACLHSDARPASGGSADVAPSLRDAFRTPDNMGMLGMPLFSPRDHSTALDFSSALAASDLSLLPDMGDPLSPVGRGPRGGRPGSGGSSIRQGGAAAAPALSLGGGAAASLLLRASTGRELRPAVSGGGSQDGSRNRAVPAPATSVMQERRLSQAGESALTPSASLAPVPGTATGTPRLALFKQGSTSVAGAADLFSPGTSAAPSHARSTGGGPGGGSSTAPGGGHTTTTVSTAGATAVRVQHHALNHGGSLDAQLQGLYASGREVAAFSGALPLLHTSRAALAVPAAAAALRERIAEVVLDFCARVRHDR